MQHQQSTALRSYSLLLTILSHLESHYRGWTRAVDGGAPTIDVSVISYAGTVRHIIEANRATHSVDVFGHSWSPELGPALDALYEPKASAHEHDDILRNRRLCLDVGAKLRQLTAALGTAPFTHFAPVGRGANSCERTANHLLGMQRAIQLKAKHERKMGFTYDLVMVARWDVLWSRPLLFNRIDLSSHAFSLPTYCTHERHVDHKDPNEVATAAARKATCGGGHAPGQVPTAAATCHPAHRPCSPDLSVRGGRSEAPSPARHLEPVPYYVRSLWQKSISLSHALVSQPRARELYLLDWWFVSSSKAADAFGLVADPPLFANYTLLNQQRLNSPKNGRPVIMGHGARRFAACVCVCVLAYAVDFPIPPTCLHDALLCSFCHATRECSLLGYAHGLGLALSTALRCGDCHGLFLGPCLEARRGSQHMPCSQSWVRRSKSVL